MASLNASNKRKIGGLNRFGLLYNNSEMVKLSNNRIKTRGDRDGSRVYDGAYQ